MVIPSNHFLTYWKKDNLGLLAGQLLTALMIRHQEKMPMCSFIKYDTIALPFLEAQQTEPEQGLWNNNGFVSVVSQADQ